MKKLFTLILTSFMFLLPLTAQEDVIPLSVEDSEDLSFEGMSDEEFDAYLETLADEMGISYDELLEMLEKDVDTISLEDEGETAVTTTGYDDEDFDLSARRHYSNGATGYEAFLADEAGLLSDKEKDDLLKEMIPITQWGNAFFYTTNNNFGMSTSELSAETYERTFA